MFAGDAGADFFNGAISVGNSGVSFWGGAGADTFSFSDIVSNGANATAYFWNEAGDDSIKFGDGISVGSGYGAAIFGVDTDAGLNIALALVTLPTCLVLRTLLAVSISVPAVTPSSVMVSPTLR